MHGFNFKVVLLKVCKRVVLRCKSSSTEEGARVRGQGQERGKYQPRGVRGQGKRAASQLPSVAEALP